MSGGCTDIPPSQQFLAFYPQGSLRPIAGMADALWHNFYGTTKP